MLRCALLLIALSAPAFADPAGFNCVMDPAQRIRLAANGSGVLSELLVRRGDIVRAGQPVARMDALLEEATVRILEARAASTAQIDAQETRAAFVGAQVERMRRLVQQNAQSVVRLEEAEYEYAVARNQLSQARSDYATLLAELERARIARDAKTIRAPIDGQVSDISLGPGESTGGERQLMTIVRLDELHVEAFLPIELYARVRRGMAVTVHPDAPVGGSYPAMITAVDSVFDTASRTFGVQVTLPNADALLPGGHRCRLTIKLDG
ncbi:MAG: efflux RND transporter periplasmic adaptor subunit [Gemmobacter sp.]|nr:efflux RND transporter periplasmic adaptor subunit [Gemmobacter sp.]